MNLDLVEILKNCSKGTNNDETKHLLGMKDNAPEKYINW